jgi:hypothetical protein
LLKLRAQDTADLEVIAAQMQDALVRVADISYDAKQRKFAFVANRFAWDAQPKNERRRAGLHFENVLLVQRRGFEQTQGDTLLSLLNIEFTLGDAPAGTVDLVFSAGHAIRLQVEYLESAMSDLGAAWAAKNAPAHE